MRCLCFAGGLLLLSAASSSAQNLCITTSTANSRDISVECGGTSIANLHEGYGETSAELCIFDGCPNPPDPGSDCGCGMSGSFEWYVSRSDTDPYDTTGSLSSNELYLWLEICGPTNGWLAAEFGLSGTLNVQSFQPVGGFQDFGTGTDLMINNAAGCVTASTSLVGILHLASAVPVPGDMEPSSWGRTKAFYAE